MAVMVQRAMDRRAFAHLTRLPANAFETESPDCGKRSQGDALEFSVFPLDFMSDRHWSSSFSMGIPFYGKKDLRFCIPAMRVGGAGTPIPGIPISASRRIACARRRPRLLLRRLPLRWPRPD